MSDGIKGTSNDTSGGKWWEVEEQSVDKSQETSQPEKSETDEEVVLGVRDTVMGRAHESAYDELIERGRDQGLSDGELAEKVEEEIPVTALLRGHGDEVYEVEASPSGRDLMEATHHLSDLDDDYTFGVGSDELRRVLNNRVFDDASADDITEMAANGDQLRQHIIDETGNHGLALDVVEQVESQVVNIATTRILDRTQPVLEEGVDNLERLNTDSNSRRAFLAGVATASGSEAEIVERLENFGVPSSDAQEMAEVLDEIRTNEFARDAFMDGNEGPKQGGLTGSLRSGAYDSVESDFEDILDDARDGMESLHRDLGRQQTQRNNELLADDYVAPIRDQVLSEMGVVMEPGGETNELGKVFAEATEDAESSRSRRNVANAAVTVGGSVVAAVATKGAAIPAIAGAIATSGVSVADARMETGMAQGAVNADLADPELLADAEHDENVAYALAAADVLTAGAAGSVGTVEAGVAGEAAGAAYEFYGHTR